MLRNSLAGVAVRDRCKSQEGLPASPSLPSLNMLVCTEGRERSLAEYTGLLREAGFTAVEAVRTGKPVDAVLARKA